MTVAIEALSCDLARIKGMSERVIVSADRLVAEPADTPKYQLVWSIEHASWLIYQPYCSEDGLPSVAPRVTSG